MKAGCSRRCKAVRVHKNRMSRSDLTARTVSSTTAYPCLDYLCEIGGFETTLVGERVGNPVLSIADLVLIATKRGLKLRAKPLNWRRLLRATTGGPVLLRLDNANMIVALKSEEADPTEIVVSDPLHSGAKPFILPSDVLQQVWSGDALVAQRSWITVERGVNWAIGLVSCAGVLAGLFFLYEAFRHALGH